MPLPSHQLLFYVAIQIIGKYLLFLNRFVSNSYTISREYDDFRGSRSCQPITLMTGLNNYRQQAYQTNFY